MVLNPFRPPPAPPAFGTGKVVPEEHATVFSLLVFNWLSGFLSVGFTRPLEKDDLWSLPDRRLTHNLTDNLERNFFARCAPSKRPVHIRKQLAAVIDDDDDEDIKEGELGNGNVYTPSTAVDDADLEKNENLDDVKEKLGHTDLHALPSNIIPRTSVPFNLAKLKFWSNKNQKASKDKKKKKKKYDTSLMKTLFYTFFWRWIVSGALKLGSDTLQTTTPLVNKLLLAWLTEAFTIHALGGDVPPGTPPVQGIGYGVGLAFALFAMQEVSSLMNNHYMFITMTNGMLVRSSIIGNIFRKSLRLSGRARLDHSVGQITTMISTDSTRLDLVSANIHNLWDAPIQIIIGIALLINNLGYSALVGVAILLFSIPIQTMLVRVMFQQRRKGVGITDKRVRLTTEVLQGIRLLKFYAWEAYFGQHIGEYREGEVACLKVVARTRSAMIAIVTVTPTMAAVLSFITYALTGHTLTPAIIFSSLQFFNIIRAPLIFFPIVLSSVADATVALGRIGKFLMAEEIDEPYLIDFERKLAVDVDGDFAWETTPSQATEMRFAGRMGGKGGSGPGGAGKNGKGGKKNGAKRLGGGGEGGKKKGKKGDILPTSASGVLVGSPSAGLSQPNAKDEKPFELNSLRMRIPKGSFVAVVGRVGSGKSSVLQALTGEMRKVKGDVVFGGSVSYVPQTAWIMNATLRENVLFGQKDNEKKFNEIIRACSLTHDLDILPYGDQTEIGEKGINLSGGQKARVSLARAAYSDTDIVLLDDPLSAVDAHVGKDILENCILNGPLSNRTIVLVTHALHLLPKTDYIYYMENGLITEEGTYQSLVKNNNAFSRLMEEFGVEETVQDDDAEAKIDTIETKEDKPEVSGTQAPLMSMEERETGSVALSVYSRYLRFAGGRIWALVILSLLILQQSSTVANNLFLGFWTAGSISGFSQGEYMIVYALLGLSQAIFAFLTNFFIAIVAIYAGLKLYKTALNHVLRSPVSFFDTTPIGRILSRLSKDQDTLDTQLSMTMSQLLTTASNILGTIGLVFYTFPLLGIIFAPLSVLYFVVSLFYRRSSVETKRLDSLMRSALYSSYSETLTGLSTVRAYREQSRFIGNAEKGLDMENRAYFMTISIQRWLSVRLDLFGNFLILGIALFASGFRNTVNPSKIGVVLSYSLSITQVFSMMVTQYAQNEQNMNAVERVLVYAELPAEGDLETPNDPPPEWPQHGSVRFCDVNMAYREGLPNVLSGVNFEIKPGEKVGIVGRTGAGKSSLLQVLFRIVEINNGEILIDDCNIREIGLDTLRKRVALVPQDSTLFLGTLRENLDPQNKHTDAEMISAMQRSWLLPRNGTPVDSATEAKFSLSSAVGDEGSNFSAGEKQLLALCRALLKDSRIIVLDEATSSVDVETDAKIQRTIQTEFVDRTLMCIAHRLNTIVYYDRILVMDTGRVAEFDTPLALFDNEESIFRSLCDEAGLTRADIVRIREGISTLDFQGNILTLKKVD